MSNNKIRRIGIGSSQPTTESPAHSRAATVARAALFGAVVFSGLFAGFLTAVLVLEASMRTAPAAVYVQVRQVELLHLDDLATVLLPAALLFTVTLATLTLLRRAPGRWPAVTAVILLAASLIISAAVNLNINSEQLGWSVLTPPPDWAHIRDRWQLAHLVRTGTAVCAFLVLTASTVTRRVSASGRR